MSDDQDSIYDDGYTDEQAEKDIDLHVAKMIEHMEWEAALPDAEKSKRRLIQFIQSLPQSAELAAQHDMPWVMFGCIERILHYTQRLLGPDWVAKVRQERKAFFHSNDDHE
jgi:hypothetical protein